MICIVLGYVIYYMVGKYNSFIFGPSHFKYQDCDIKYDQEYLNLDYNSATDPNNRWLEDSAKSVFIKCLCDKYILTRDENIKNLIDSIYYGDTWYQGNFNSEVKGFDSIILMKYKKVIFKNDSKVLSAISKYKNDNEGIILLLKDKLKNSYESRLEYYRVLYSIPENKVPIDTIIKYKETIFKIPPHYGDA